MPKITRRRRGTEKMMDKHDLIKEIKAHRLTQDAIGGAINRMKADYAAKMSIKVGDTVTLSGKNKAIVVWITLRDDLAVDRFRLQRIKKDGSEEGSGQTFAHWQWKDLKLVKRGEAAAK